MYPFFSLKKSLTAINTSRRSWCLPRLEALEDRSLMSVLAGPIQNPANGHQYYLLKPSTWTAAEAEAVSLGGHLATINDAAENDWVYNTFIPLTGTITPSFRPALWIGLTDAAVEGSFVWVNGEPVAYTNWAPPEEPSGFPGEDYVHMIDPLGGSERLSRWNDLADVAISGPVVLHGVVEVNSERPDLVADTLTWNTTQGGVDFSYRVEGA